MKYKNKTEERLKNRLASSITADKVISTNKMKKQTSSLRSAKFNIGKIVNKTSQYDKNMEKLSDKVNNAEEISNKKDFTIKAFNKGNDTYIKYKNNDIPVSQLTILSKTDNDIRNLIKNLSQQKAEQKFAGSFNEFLLKQYS